MKQSILTKGAATVATARLASTLPLAEAAPAPGLGLLGASGTVLLLLCVAGCATAVKQPVQPATSAKPSAKQAAPPAAAMSSTRYFTEASAIDLFQIRAADIALSRATGPARAFALESRRQHVAISAQMSFAGRYLNLLPSPVLPREYEQMLTALRSAENFNSVYLAQQRRLCERALKLHTDYARSGDSPTLRAVARFAAKAVASEQQLLRG